MKFRKKAAPADESLEDASQYLRQAVKRTSEAARKNIANTSCTELPQYDDYSGFSGPQPPQQVREFETGATRDSDDGKPDYEGYNSPLVEVRFGEYMTRHRVQSDGSLRSSDNWQKGIPMDQYAKSLCRHVQSFLALHDGYSVLDKKGNPVSIEDVLCAIRFNADGYLHELLKASSYQIREAWPLGAG